MNDAAAIAEQAPRLGATVLSPPTDAPWIRMTVIRDPQGAVFTASQFVPPTIPARSEQPGPDHAGGLAPLR